MAFINLLHNGYQGKLGETVGQKWKNQRTVRTYNPHNNSKSKAQLTQREFYKTLITAASWAYPSRNNFPSSASKSMNSFNYYSRILNTILKKGVIGGQFLYTDVFNREDICHPYRYYMDGYYYLFVTVPASIETVYLKDYKLVTIFNRNRNTQRYEPVDIAFNNVGAPRQFKAGTTAQTFRRGFLWRIDQFPSYNGELFVAVARKKGSKWEYSGIFDMRGVSRNDWANFETPVPPLTVIS